MSKIRHIVAREPAQARNSSAEPNVSTSNPLAVSKRSIAFRTARSSSMTVTFRRVAIRSLAPQLRSSLDVSVSCDGLVSAAPHRPGDDVSGPDAALGQAHRHTPDLLDRPADQSAAWQALVFVFGG